MIRKKKTDALVAVEQLGGRGETQESPEYLRSLFFRKQAQHSPFRVLGLELSCYESPNYGRSPHSPLYHTLRMPPSNTPRVNPGWEERQKQWLPSRGSEGHRPQFPYHHSNNAPEAQVRGPKLTLDATPGTVPSLLG